MKRRWIAGILFLMTGVLFGSPKPSPLRLDTGWQAIVEAAVEAQASGRPASEYTPNQDLWDWMLGRLWEGEGDWSVLRGESIAAIKDHRIVLKAAERSLTKQLESRKRLLDELSEASRNRKSVPDLGLRMRRLQPVLPDRRQLSVSVVQAPEDDPTTDSGTVPISPVRPAPYTQDLASSIRQLDAEIEILLARLEATKDDLDLIENAAAEDFLALHHFLAHHFEGAVEVNRQKRERLRRSTEAPTKN